MKKTIIVFALLIFAILLLFQVSKYAIISGDLKIEIAIGVIAIIFLIHLTLGKDLSYSTNEILGYISIFISLSFVFFGIKHYRDKVNNGVVTLGKAIIIGFLISILVAIGIALADFIYTKFINPNWFDNYYKMMEDAGKEDEIMEMTSLTAGIFMLTLVSVIGFIISLISGLILQRK